MIAKHRSARTVILACVLLPLALFLAARAFAQDPPGACPDSPQLASADEQAVIGAAGAALDDYATPGIGDWSIVNVQGAGEWAVVNIAPSTTTGEALTGDGDIVLARQQEGNWSVALPTSEAFRAWLPLVPPDLLVAFPERNAFAVLASPQAASAGLYRLPYACGARAWVSRAGADHDNAIDFIIQSASGGKDPIVAAADGVVYQVMQSRTACCCKSAYSSNYIILRHPNGEYSYYLHLAANSALVKVGDHVRQGDPIAAEGDVGYSCSTSGGSCRTRYCYVDGYWDYCCEHLHFEVRDNGNWKVSRLNPRFEDVPGQFVVSQKYYTSGNCPGCDDAEAPATDFVEASPVPGAYFGDSVSLGGWAVDGGECTSGIDHVDVRALFEGNWNGTWCGEWCTVARLDLEGGEDTPVEFSYTWDLRDVPAGVILLALEVYDGAGNHSANYSGERPVYHRDDSPPHLSLERANEYSLTSQDQIVRSSESEWSFSGTASDLEGLDRITLFAQGGSQVTGTIAGAEDWGYPLSGTVRLEGATTATFRAYDALGQHNPPGDRDTVRLLVDGMPPLTAADLEGTAGENGWYRSAVTVHLSAADQGSGQGWGAWASGLESLHYQIDGQSWQEQAASSRTLTFNGQSGDHVVNFYSVDDLANQEPVRQVPVRIDVTPPGAAASTETHGVASGQWQRAVSRPSFSWDPAVDATSGVWYYLLSWGDTLALTTTAAFDPPAVTTGVYTLTVQAVDRAGNQGPATSPSDFRYDGSRPHAPEILHQAGVLSGVCQNQVRTADFVWATPEDAGSGVAGYHLYWGPDPGGISTTLTTTETYIDPLPICQEDGAATYYFRAQAEDRVGWDSEWVGFVLVYDGSPPTASLEVNEPLATNRSRTGALTIIAADEGCGVDRMRLSNDGENWTDWQPLASSVEWPIAAASEQSQAVHLQVIDKAGNVSEVVASSSALDGDEVLNAPSIAPASTLDASCPFYRLTVDEGVAYTIQPTVTLSLCGPDPSEVMLAHDPEFVQATWRPFAATVDWLLDGDEQLAGERWVYARFRDSSGLEHGTFADDILYDPTPPQGEVAFRLANLLPADGPAAPHSEQPTLAEGATAPLTIQASDTGSGLAEMQVSLAPDLGDALWQPFSATIPLTFASDGVHAAYVRLRDRAGNVSAILSDTIVVDTVPPVGTARVAGGTVGPAAIAATVELSAADGTSGVSQVRIGASPLLTDTGWQSYAPQITVPISPAGALSGSLYVQFRDVVGNRSAVVPAPYQVDETPPQGWIEYEGSDASNTATFRLHIDDDKSAIAETWISPDYSFLDRVTRLPFQDLLTWHFTGSRYIFARFVDAAGNATRPYLLLCPGYGNWTTAVYLPLVVKAK